MKPFTNRTNLYISTAVLTLIAVTLVIIGSVTQTPSASAQTQTAVYLPIIQTSGTYIPPVDGQHPTGGNCPAGSHLVSATGAPGIDEPDTSIYTDAEYLCVPDETVADVTCSAFGTASVMEGTAVCGCQEGYTGASCELCAPDYEWATATSQCVPVTPPADPVVLTATTQAIVYGETLLVSASSGTAVSDYDWEIMGDGCFVDPAGGGCDPNPDVSANADMLVMADWGGAGSPPSISTFRVSATPSGGTGGGIGNFDIAAFDADSVPVTGDGHFRLQPLISTLSDYMRYRCVGAGVVGISYYGKPIGIWGLGRMNGRAELNSLPECGNNTENPYNAGSALVQPDTPFRIGSISKSVGFAIGRAAAKEQWFDVFGEYPSNNEIEELTMVGSILDLPPSLSTVYSGGVDVPVPINVTGSLVDFDWFDVTLGHFLSHRTGLSRSGASAIEYSHTLPVLRGFDPYVKQNYQNQDDILTTEYGAGVVNTARTAAANDAGASVDNTFFLPQMNLEELLLLNAGLTLNSVPGEEHVYSNLGPAYVATMAEEMTGLEFAAAIGDTDSHEGTLVDNFFDNAVGMPTTGQSGVFQAQVTWPIQPNDPEPSKRYWNGSQGTYTPFYWDKKRPHCIWNGTFCSFDYWRYPNSGANMRWATSWGWQPSKVPVGYTTQGISPASGTLAADAETFLSFMSQYWIGGYAENPRIGEERTQWGLHTTHNGAFKGAFAWAMQLGSNSDNTIFELPSRSDDGKTVLNAFGRGINFFAADGQAVTYGSDGYSTSAFSHDADAFAVGQYDLSGEDRLYIATETFGMVGIYTPSGVQLDEFDIGFSENDRMFVADIGDNDVFDEIILIKGDSDYFGTIELYDHDGTFISSHHKSITLDDAVAVGSTWGDEDHNRRNTNRLFIAYVDDGDVHASWFDSLNASSAYKLGYQAGDGFAVGNAIGGVDNRDEILIGRQDSGRVEVYVYGSGDYVLHEDISFDGFYETGGAIAIADTNLTYDEILVGQTSTGKVRVFKGNVVDDGEDVTYEVQHIETLQGAGGEDGLYIPSMFLAVGNADNGRLAYQCSSADGIKRDIPNGVDVFVAINQWNQDRSCLSDGSYSCKEAYGLLDNFIMQAACEIDWTFIDQLDVVIP